MVMATFWKAAKLLWLGEERAAPQTTPAQNHDTRTGQPEHSGVSMIAPANNNTVTGDFQSLEQETQQQR